VIIYKGWARADDLCQHHSLTGARGVRLTYCLFAVGHNSKSC